MCAHVHIVYVYESSRVTSFQITGKDSAERSRNRSVDLLLFLFFWGGGGGRGEDVSGRKK